MLRSCQRVLLTILLNKTIAMKKIIFLPLLLFTTLIAFSQNKQVPPAWGHYKKISSFSPSPIKGMEPSDTLHLLLATRKKKVKAIERNSGPSIEKLKAPESKCDPAACQPGELIG